jgi:ADP-ribose pyrophosphatase YjhB (NUDIX family)
MSELRIVEQAGTVLYRVIDGKIEILTVRSKTFPEQRIFPKGHVERGETPEQTAARELLEEGGMAGEIGGFCGLREFVFNNKRYRVRYYAAKYISKENEGEPNREPVWASVEETRAILPYNDLKEVLDKCVGLITVVP